MPKTGAAPETPAPENPAPETPAGVDAAHIGISRLATTICACPATAGFANEHNLKLHHAGVHPVQDGGTGIFLTLALAGRGSATSGRRSG
jgi:hypothetical protein